MTNSKNIFLVEDDEDDQTLFIEAIKDIDHSLSIRIATNGVDALSKLDNTNNLPDIIFMDINMPFMNGFECLTELKKEARLKNIPVVILTTSNNPAEAELAKVLGASSFISKPFNFSLWKMNLANILKENLSINVMEHTYNISDPSLLLSIEPHIIVLVNEGLS